jgi:hypothetical protein
MTPAASVAGMPLSRITLGALEDLYGAGAVDYSKADPYYCGQASIIKAAAPAAAAAMAPAGGPAPAGGAAPTGATAPAGAAAGAATAAAPAGAAGQEPRAPAEEPPQPEGIMLPTTPESVPLGGGPPRPPQLSSVDSVFVPANGVLPADAAGP